MFLVCLDPLTVLEVRSGALRLLERLAAAQDATVSEFRDYELRFLRRLADLGLATLEPVPTEWPAVAVVIPVRDRSVELRSCLDSLGDLRYPPDRVRVVVVDDGSIRPAVVPPGVHLVRLEKSVGPGAARNAGAAACRSELLAFLDSDCVADAGWLEALAIELVDPQVAAAGGRVHGLHDRSWLERYEAVRSPLDLGRSRATSRPREMVPYLVTANLLVRRSAFDAVGGFARDLRWGEDVDLCWQLCESGHRLIYRPDAVVRHAHRGRLPAFALTRMRYAASEAGLLTRHPGNGRWLGFSQGMAALIVGAAGAALGQGTLLVAGAAAFAVETVVGAGRFRALGVSNRAGATAILRGQANGLYHLSRQLVRYYSVGIGAVAVACLAGRARRRMLFALTAAAVVPGLVDWRRLRPRLGLAPFVGAHLLDEAAYQVGTLYGCLRQRTLAPLRVELRLIPQRRARPEA